MTVQGKPINATVNHVEASRNSQGPQHGYIAHAGIVKVYGVDAVICPIYDRSTGLLLSGHIRGNPVLYHLGIIDTGHLDLEYCSFDLGSPNLASEIAVSLFEILPFILLGIEAVAVVYLFFGKRIRDLANGR